MFKRIMLGAAKKLKFLPADTYAKIHYEYYTGKRLDLANPKEFNEKIQWIKTYYRPPILNKLVDKYAVRDYVEKTIGKEYLNDCLGVYNKVSEIDFNALPDQFVLKGVHGCNYNLIVKDKKRLNIPKAKLKIHKWLNQNYYYKSGQEWAYKDIKPRIICEKYLCELNNDSLNDYKLYCFNGKVKLIQVDLDRYNNFTRAFYDVEWNKQPFTKGTHCTPLDKSIEKPKALAKMIQLAEKLGKNFPFVRIDMYALEEKIIFGEMTFYPGDGRIEFSPDSYNKKIGDWIEIPELIGGQTCIKKVKNQKEIQYSI
ncbi:ATP-grasp fold amidoligase family protein [Zhouia amylolytica]|uniref:ATP-grasp fold amidoligase family protein n=1 Tax=Zhouia amylolytica TaxID=376730 RepID=UPI0020CBFE5D|nr:ATP-grasp fold amidoligase family protein [Zhouia amylolytica]MCQ0111344.1 glycosyltransferase [Zhouia amylolytica]